MYGVRGPPTRSEDRHLSKLFDYKRKRAKEQGGTSGCDDDFQLREITMAVGQYTRGGLRAMSRQTAERTQKLVNIDKTTQQERKLAKIIDDRGKTDSAFTGDNHFYQLTKLKNPVKCASPERRNFSQMMNYDNQSISFKGQQSQLGHVSGKKHYYQRHTKAQSGLIDPILNLKNNARSKSIANTSKLTNYTMKEGSQELFKNSLYSPEKLNAVNKSPSFGTNDLSEADKLKKEMVLVLTQFPKIHSQQQNDGTASKNCVSSSLQLRNDHNKIYYTQYKQTDVDDKMGYASKNNTKRGAVQVDESDEILDKSNEDPLIDDDIIDQEEMIDRGFSGEGWRQTPNRSQLRPKIISTFAADHQNHISQQLPNESKIMHGDYHVSTTYGGIPNEHNQDELFPQSFPLRTNLDFVKSNKKYDQTHTYDKLMNHEI